MKVLKNNELSNQDCVAKQAAIRRTIDGMMASLPGAESICVIIGKKIDNGDESEIMSMEVLGTATNTEMLAAAGAVIRSVTRLARDKFPKLKAQNPARHDDLCQLEGMAQQIEDMIGATDSPEATMQ